MTLFPYTTLFRSRATSICAWDEGDGGLEEKRCAAARGLEEEVEGGGGGLHFTGGGGRASPAEATHRGFEVRRLSLCRGVGMGWAGRLGAAASGEEEGAAASGEEEGGGRKFWQPAGVPWCSLAARER